MLLHAPYRSADAANLKTVELANLTTATLEEVIGPWHGIERVRGTPHLADAFLRRTGLSVA